MSLTLVARSRILTTAHIIWHQSIHRRWTLWNAADDRAIALTKLAAEVAVLLEFLYDQNFTAHEANMKNVRTVQRIANSGLAAAAMTQPFAWPFDV